jgi:hypothetical protein
VFKYLHDPNGHAPYSSERNPMLDDYRVNRKPAFKMLEF